MMSIRASPAGKVPAGSATLVSFGSSAAKAVITEFVTIATSKVANRIPQP